MWMAYCLVPYQNTATDLVIINGIPLRSRTLSCTDQALMCDYYVDKCKGGICDEQSQVKALCHNSNLLKRNSAKEENFRVEEC